MFGNLNSDVRQTLDHFHRSVDQLFEDFFGNSSSEGRSFNGTHAVFAPGLESAWTDDSLNLRAVIPGVTEKDLNVTVQGNQLIIEGERKAPESDSGGAAWRQLSYGKFYRKVDLPHGLDLEKLECHLHDGLLDLRIPVTEKMKPRRIKISSAPKRKMLAA